MINDQTALSKNQELKAVNLCYAGNKLLTLTSFAGRYFYIPCKEGERKAKEETGPLPADYSYFESKDELVIDELLLSPFKDIMEHALRTKIFELDLKRSDADMDIIYKYAKVNADNNPINPNLYVEQTSLKIMSYTEAGIPEFKEVEKSAPAEEAAHV